MKTLLLAILFVAWASVAQAATQTATFTLAWTDNSATEDGFKIERRLGQTGTFAQVGQVAANIVAFKDSFLNDSGNNQYCYRVRAFNSAGDSAYSNIACAITPVIVVPPTAPSGVTVSVTVVVTVP